MDGWADQKLECPDLHCQRDNCPRLPNSGQEDVDLDGYGDGCDEDADGDNVQNTQDNCPLNFNTEQVDSDGDRVGDVCDNCVLKYNPRQLDTDEDGLGMSATGISIMIPYLMSWTTAHYCQTPVNRTGTMMVWAMCVTTARIFLIPIRRIATWIL